MAAEYMGVGGESPWHEGICGASCGGQAYNHESWGRPADSAPEVMFVVVSRVHCGGRAVLQDDVVDRDYRL